MSLLSNTNMDVVDSALLHAIDRTITDLLPDKHLYEPDLQLYLDYSLPPHPDLPLLEEVQEYPRPRSVSDDELLPDRIASGNPSWKGALLQPSNDQPSADAKSFVEPLPESAEASSQPSQDGADNAEDSGKVEAQEDGSTVSDKGHNYGVRVEGVSEGDTLPWPALIIPSDTMNADTTPTVQLDATASHDSRPALNEYRGCEEESQQVSEPQISEQMEVLPSGPSHDAGHIMPLRSTDTRDASLEIEATGDCPADSFSLAK